MDDKLHDALRTAVPEPGPGYWRSIDARLAAITPELADTSADTLEQPTDTPMETSGQVIRLTTMNTHETPRDRRSFTLVAVAAAIAALAIGAGALALTRSDDDQTELAITDAVPQTTDTTTPAIGPETTIANVPAATEPGVVEPTEAPTTVEATTAPPTTLPLSIPDSFHGTWRESTAASVTAVECREDGGFEANFGKVLDVREDGFSLFETGGRLLAVNERSDTRIDARYDTTYADTPTEANLIFELQDDAALVVTEIGAEAAAAPIRYVRCPEAQPLTADEAEQLIVESGDWAPDMSTYDPAAGLSAVKAVTPGGASAASPEQIFLFASGEFVGTPTPEFRIASSFERVDDTAFRLTYGHYESTDPFCCPSLEPWVVEVRWDGNTLIYDGDLPPQNQGLG
jgi:hypothetical protein